MFRNLNYVTIKFRINGTHDCSEVIKQTIRLACCTHLFSGLWKLMQNLSLVIIFPLVLFHFDLSTTLSIYILANIVVVLEHMLITTKPWKVWHWYKFSSYLFNRTMRNSWKWFKVDGWRACRFKRQIEYRKPYTGKNFRMNVKKQHEKEVREWKIMPGVFSPSNLLRALVMPTDLSSNLPVRLLT